MIATPRGTLGMIVAAATMAFVAADRMNVDGPAANEDGRSAMPNRQDRVQTEALPSRDRAVVRPAARDPFSPPPPPAPAPPPPVAVVAAPPPPPPRAPALPFKYFGRLSHPSGVLAEFVESSGRLLSVTKGEVIDDVYRVEEVSGSEIVFIHLPTQQRQVLPLPPP